MFCVDGETKRNKKNNKTDEKPIMASCLKKVMLNIKRKNLIVNIDLLNC